MSQDQIQNQHSIPDTINILRNLQTTQSLINSLQHLRNQRQHRQTTETSTTNTTKPSLTDVIKNIVTYYNQSYSGLSLENNQSYLNNRREDCKISKIITKYFSRLEDFVEFFDNSNLERIKTPISEWSLYYQKYPFPLTKRLLHQASAPFQIRNMPDGVRVLGDESMSLTEEEDEEEEEEEDEEEDEDETSSLQSTSSRSSTHPTPSTPPSTPTHRSPRPRTNPPSSPSTAKLSYPTSPSLVQQYKKYRQKVNFKREVARELEAELGVGLAKLEDILEKYPKMCVDAFDKMTILEKDITNCLDKTSHTIRWLYGFCHLFPATDLSGNKVSEELDIFIANHLQEYDISDKIVKYYQAIERCKILSQYSKLVNQINIAPRCPICLTSVIDSFLTCGHTGCQSCLLRLDVCHVCRGEITRIGKIYYP